MKKEAMTDDREAELMAKLYDLHGRKLEIERDIAAVHAELYWLQLAAEESK